MNIFGFDLLSLLPWLTTLAGIVWGFFAHTGKQKAEKDAAHEKLRADGEKSRAEVSEKIANTVINLQRSNEKVVNDAVKEAMRDRDYFSDK